MVLLLFARSAGWKDRWKECLGKRVSTVLFKKQRSIRSVSPTRKCLREHHGGCSMSSLDSLPPPREGQILFFHYRNSIFHELTLIARVPTIS